MRLDSLSSFSHLASHRKSIACTATFYLTVIMENVEAQSNDDRATKATWATTDFRLKGTVKKFILCVVIAVVWMMLAIPIVMFYLPQVGNYLTA